VKIWKKYTSSRNSEEKRKKNIELLACLLALLACLPANFAYTCIYSMWDIRIIKKGLHSAFGVFSLSSSTKHDWTWWVWLELVITKWKCVSLCRVSSIYYHFTLRTLEYNFLYFQFSFRCLWGLWVRGMMMMILLKLIRAKSNNEMNACRKRVCNWVSGSY
jgi:hypothetical protein